MTQQGGDSFVYDQADRHIATTGTGVTVTYSRDASGAIVARSEGGATVRYSGGAPLSTSNTVLERSVPLPGGVIVTKLAAGDVWSYPNVHGDIAAVGDNAGVKQGPTYIYDPYGNAASLPDNSHGAFDFGWVGQHSKHTEHTTGLGTVIEMGARIYHPGLGRFLSVDPIEGGNFNDYLYPADPVNGYDLDGRVGSMPICPRWGLEDVGHWSWQTHTWSPGYNYGMCAYTTADGLKVKNRIAAAKKESGLGFHIDLCVVVCVGLGRMGGHNVFKVGGLGLGVLGSVDYAPKGPCATAGFADTVGYVDGVGGSLAVNHKDGAAEGGWDWANWTASVSAGPGIKMSGVEVPGISGGPTHTWVSGC